MLFNRTVTLDHGARNGGNQGSPEYTSGTKSFLDLCYFYDKFVPCISGSFGSWLSYEYIWLKVGKIGIFHNYFKYEALVSDHLKIILDTLDPLDNDLKIIFDTHQNQCMIFLFEAPLPYYKSVFLLHMIFP